MDLHTINRIHRKGEIERAEKLYRTYLKSHPDCVIGNALLGTVYLQRGLFGMALNQCRKALDLNPNQQEVYGDAIVACRRLGRLDEAIEFAEMAEKKFGPQWERIRKKGKLSGTASKIIGNLYNNFGSVLLERAELERADEVLRRGLQYSPDHTDLNWNLGIVRLAQGKWDGWFGYEYGFRTGERKARPYFDEIENWTGQDLTDKTILVWGEQGIGDEILFAQCLPDIAKIAGKVVVDCHPRLEGIFRRSFPDMEVYGWRKDYAPGLFDDHKIDFQAPVGSLPLFFRQEDDQFLRAPYLIPRAEEVKKFRDQGPGFRIGLSWSGGIQRTGQRKRSMPLDQMMTGFYGLPKKLMKGVQLVCLQYGEGVFETVDAAQKFGGYPIECHDGAIEEFEAQADLTASCDLVLSVVQTTVHLAGALGVPTLCLAPYAPPWKFVKQRQSPWHASVTQYHQETQYDWSKPLARAFNEIRQQLEQRQNAAA